MLTGSLPAYAGPGPVPLDTKDSYVAARAFEMSSSASGTVHVADAGTGLFGHVYLVPGRRVAWGVPRPAPAVGLDALPDVTRTVAR